jgi:hypothetical protein
MSGWKTYAGAAVIAISAGLEAFGKHEWAQILATLGGSLGLVGLRHAVKKTEDK